MLSRKRVHVVCTTSDLRYDGRVFSMINTLARSYPMDIVYILELTSSNYVVENLYDNVKYKRIGWLSRINTKSRLLRYISCLEYAIVTLGYMLLKSPKSIQVHHEGVLLSTILYKKLFPKTILVYDDKEFYNPKDRNIAKPIFLLEKKVIQNCDLLIETNCYRKRAVNSTVCPLSDVIVVDNYVFGKGKCYLGDLLETIKDLKNRGQRIMLHQGDLSDIRGTKQIYEIIESLQENWILLFIGLSRESFAALHSRVAGNKEKILYGGYIPYQELNSFWSYMDAGVLFYDACSFNNKYCAPNRLYLAVNNGVPIIVNSDNYTLTRFLKEYRCGLSYPDSRLECFYNSFAHFKQNALSLKDRFVYDDYYIQDLANFYVKK